MFSKDLCIGVVLFNRLKTVPLCLKYASSAKWSLGRKILVVSYSHPRYMEKLRSLVRNYWAKEVVEISFKEPVKIPVARNKILQTSRQYCRYLFFLDDDVLVPPTIFEESRELLQTYHVAWGIVGMEERANVENNPPKPYSIIVNSSIHKLEYDENGFPAGKTVLEKPPTLLKYLSEHILKDHWKNIVKNFRLVRVSFIWAGALMIDLEKLPSNIMFNPRKTVWEDWEFMRDVESKGLRTYVETREVTIHWKPPSQPSALSNMKRFWQEKF